MNKNIIYNDIEYDKYNLIEILSYMSVLYKEHQNHKQVLECNQWITMLNRRPLNIEYTADAILCLKNIVNDAVNFLTINGHIADAKIGLSLYNKICKLFCKNMNKTIVWVAVDSNGDERISSNSKGFQRFIYNEDKKDQKVQSWDDSNKYTYDHWIEYHEDDDLSNFGAMPTWIFLPKGSIEKLIGRKLTWEDEPVKIEDE